MCGTYSNPMTNLVGERLAEVVVGGAAAGNGGEEEDDTLIIDNENRIYE
jgi:hypothetical protein